MTLLRSGALERPFEELAARAARLAGGLAALGAQPGDRVALLMHNEARFVEASIGIGLAGCAPVPINSHWTVREVAHVLADSGSRVVLAHGDLVGVVEEAAPGATVVEVLAPDEVAAAFGLAGSATTPSDRHAEYEALVAESAPPSAPVTAAPMSVIYTSGTTGTPKGVVRDPTPPDRAPALAQLICQGLAFAPGMKTLIPAPLYHTAPNVHALFAVRMGCELTLMPRFDPEALLALVQAHRIEHIQMVPTMFTRLLALPEETRARYDVSSLRSVVHAAAPCPVEVKRAMIDWWGPVIHEYYGGTEVGLVVTTDTESWLAHPGTVGRPVGDAAVRIVAGDDGRDAAPGETGEIYLRPPSVWPDFTYMNLPEQRAAVGLADYVTLGDVGHLDADGFLHITDRVKDMVISGGVNVYPAEIEQCLMTMDGVADVAVFGIPDADWGEAIAAHVQLHPGAVGSEDAVRDHVRQELAGYKVPRVVVFEDLPREDTGKLFKRRLAERYAPR
ncbi:AMP-binding protein [Baekduia sp. Peel2402]|uniref:AMP-binding protein n=1 Tax=Baekduia sp. Peel2402 TaxID=3458296 RepID=UPI00403EA188